MGVEGGHNLTCRVGAYRACMLRRAGHAACPHAPAVSSGGQAAVCSLTLQQQLARSQSQTVSCRQCQVSQLAADMSGAVQLPKLHQHTS